MEVPRSDLAGRGVVDSIMDSHTDSRISSVTSLTSDSLSFMASLKHVQHANLSGKAVAPHTQQVLAAGRVCWLRP